MRELATFLDNNSRRAALARSADNYQVLRVKVTKFLSIVIYSAGHIPQLQNNALKTQAPKPKLEGLWRRRTQNTLGDVFFIGLDRTIHALARRSQAAWLVVEGFCAEHLFSACLFNASQSRP